MSQPLPRPVGPASVAALAALSGRTMDVPGLPHDPFDLDAQLGWFLLNEASFGGWDGVDDGAEWHPDVVSLRRAFERWFETQVASGFDDIADPVAAVEAALTDDCLSVSGYLAECGTRAQVLEALLIRYPYQYKEADPHTFVVPRIDGEVKRALCEIQSGEYGVGHGSTHAELFRSAVSALGVDARLDRLVDVLPGAAFATANLVSMGGLNRARRGVALGQLALFEMDSVVPNGRMVEVCDRLRLPDATRQFFDIHVMADAEHQVIARRAFLETYPATEPEQRENLLFGIKAQHTIDVALAEHAVPAWRQGASALRPARLATAA